LSKLQSFSFISLLHSFFFALFFLLPLQLLIFGQAVVLQMIILPSVLSLSLQIPQLLERI